MAIKRRDFLKGGLSIAALGLVAPSFLVRSAYALTGDGKDAVSRGLSGKCTEQLYAAVVEFAPAVYLDN